MTKMQGQAVTIEKSFERYCRRYFHQGREDECFVCGLPKEDMIENELKLCGYFCIITSEEMSARALGTI